MSRTAAQDLIDSALRGELTDDDAKRLALFGPEVVTLALLAASKRIAEQNARLDEFKGKPCSAAPSPATPSAMVPVYAKPNKRKGRKRRPGARPGHQGVRRERPARIDRRETHRLKCCPHCQGPLQRCRRTRRRLIEDIPEVIEPLVSEHTVHRDYCPKCKRHVEPVVADAMPKAALGHRVVALTSWFHYGLGLTIDQVVDILGYHLQTKLTSGGPVDAWRRLAEVLEAWYQQIGRQAKASAHLHADETGWRVNGQTHWLWCFTNDRNCYYRERLMYDISIRPRVQDCRCVSALACHTFSAPGNTT
ncbi:MAG: transposase, partial [Verrucomicrobiota bacterium]